MGRPKKFNREEVLSKVLPLFWAKGFADTALQEIERATGVNKSGLYSEFQSKDELFVESLRYYYAKSEGQELLDRQPLGFDNIEAYYRKISSREGKANMGCFAVNCLREIDQLPDEARLLIEGSKRWLQEALIKNIRAEETSLPAEQIADMISTAFSGICIEQNLNQCTDLQNGRIAALMHILRRS